MGIASYAWALVVATESQQMEVVNANTGAGFRGRYGWDARRMAFCEVMCRELGCRKLTVVCS